MDTMEEARALGYEAGADGRYTAVDARSEGFKAGIEERGYYPSGTPYITAFARGWWDGTLSRADPSSRLLVPLYKEVVEKCIAEFVEGYKQGREGQQ